jgi:serine/threonine protein kinase/class 3 adenylate cyclase
MSLQQFRLLKQMGVGDDGTVFAAENPEDGRACRVHFLSPARANPERWPELARRFRLLRLLDHPAAVQLLEMEPDHDPPYVVLDAVGEPLLATLGKRVPLPLSEVMSLAQEMIRLLAEAHRLGITHGTLSPAQVFQTAAGGIKIDFSGLRTQSLPPDPAAYQAPEVLERKEVSSASDFYSLGAILHWVLSGKEPPAPRQSAARETIGDSGDATGETSNLVQVASSLLAFDPGDRPLAGEILEALGSRAAGPAQTKMAVRGESTLETTRHGSASGSVSQAAVTGDVPERLGRYRVIEKIGQGGMGVVFRGEDPVDGRIVAIKVLRADLARRSLALRRFHKEARLLAEVNNPYVANLLEVNEDNGTHFLVMEFVQGQSLYRYLKEQGRLSETLALGVIADVSRALVEAHERGIVHRDIKPENVLLQPRDESANAAFTAKLTDFGLARHVVESESLDMTQAGTLLGTPYYMAPEQCKGLKEIDPRADVYALGATLFHLLAGRPPFMATNHLTVLGMHCNDAPPPMKSLNSAVTDVVSQLIEKCLAKAPDDRFPNAGALLNAVERILRGEASSVAVHPLMPQCEADKLVQYDWVWELEAPPEKLWPHVSNTERVNRAAGMTPVQFSVDNGDEKGVRRFGEFRKAGVRAAWEEHPYEWVEARRMGVLREYSSGPFKWLVSIVELSQRPAGGTTLTHRVRIEPHGLVGRTLAAVEVGIRGYRTIEKLYRRIDAAVTGKLGSEGLADPFEEPPPLSPARRSRLDALLDRLGKCGIEPAVLERLGEFLELAPPQEVARIRPLALARRLGLDPDQMATACLQGAREGLLLLLWDILCPVCRIPSDVKETLKALQSHGRCEACNLDFELDFANSVEMIFRAHPEVRESELGVYCIGGPAHSPHVVAQVRVAAGERIELDLRLSEGSYRLRGPQLPFVFDFRVLPAAPVSRFDANLGRGPDETWPKHLKAGRQTVVLTHDLTHELVARIERSAAREDALTAARASTMSLFRELFPGEVLSPGQLVSVANVTLLWTALDHMDDLYRRLGDARAFAIVHEHFRLLNDCVRKEGGAVVKTVGEGLLATFSESVGALRAGLAMQKILSENELTKDLAIRVAVHRGPAMTATLNDHLDYFGSTVAFSSRLTQFARPGEVVLSQPTGDDPQVAALLKLRQLEPEVLAVDAPGREQILLLCLKTESRSRS